MCQQKDGKHPLDNVKIDMPASCYEPYDEKIARQIAEKLIASSLKACRLSTSYLGAAFRRQQT